MDTALDFSGIYAPGQPDGAAALRPYAKARARHSVIGVPGPRGGPVVLPQSALGTGPNPRTHVGAD
ncbi:hypothetical protein ACODT5_00705 [Streptomyces sp. 5.8]|uniref:hypothetical protein n=1 Tax=Streptomyces sp. 5.8 TaxID=3406571 RepID=UPI003BB5FFA1